MSAPHPGSEVDNHLLSIPTGRGAHAGVRIDWRAGGFAAMMRRMSRAPVALPLALVAGTLLCAAATAAAASVTVAKRCDVPGAKAPLTARGFAPRAPLTVTVDGRVLRYADGSLPSTDASGGYRNAFYAPALRAAQTQRRVAVSASDGASSARTSFTLTKPTGGGFSPSHGDPRTLKVRFSVWGFRLHGERNARTYLHWIAPNGQVRATAPLGTTGGDCGALRTRPRRIFPFPAQTGRWRLVIDTHARYRAHARGPRAMIAVNVRPLSL